LAATNLEDTTAGIVVTTDMAQTTAGFVVTTYITRFNLSLTYTTSSNKTRFVSGAAAETDGGAAETPQ